MKKTLYLVFVCLFPFVSYAQKTVELKNSSSQYQATLTIDDCKTQDCRGKGSVTFTDKKTKKVLQTIAVQDMVLKLTEGQEPLHQIDLSKDCNFDGEADLVITTVDAALGTVAGAINQGNFYIFDKKKKQFVLHQELTKLSNESLSGWKINKDKKRLDMVYEKTTTGYENVRGYTYAKGKLVLVYEAFQKVDDKDYITTIRELINGKWVEKVTREKF